MYGLIVDNLVYEPKMIIRHIQQTYHYNISYMKALRSKRKLFEMRFVTYEDSYDNLPHMLCKIIVRNLRIYFDVLDFLNSMGGPNIFQRVFFGLGVCVKPFRFCLSVICIDDTFLVGKYKD
jgi:hypothetical protein